MEGFASADQRLIASGGGKASSSSQIRLCVIQCFNATVKMLTDFQIPKERTNGIYQVRCMISAFNTTSKESWIYAEFERMKQTVMIRALERYGATQITLVSFSSWDYATGSSNGLQSVLSKAKEPGFQLIQQSMPSRYVSVKMDSCADHEFDVVKKRRIMDSCPDLSDDPRALSYFEEFEANVLPALFEVSSDYQKVRHEELLELELDVCNQTAPARGCVYVAVSPAVKYPKIGATRRSDPSLRLRELSRHVPSPFKLVFTVSTLTPFSLEAEVHRHFDAFRLREKGACTEFFSVELESIEKFFLEKYPEFEKH